MTAASFNYGNLAALAAALLTSGYFVAAAIAPALG
jgi:hypothetical protein